MSCSLDRMICEGHLFNTLFILTSFDFDDTCRLLSWKTVQWIIFLFFSATCMKAVRACQWQL